MSQGARREWAVGVACLLSLMAVLVGWQQGLDLSRLGLLVASIVGAGAGGWLLGRRGDAGSLQQYGPAPPAATDPERARTASVLESISDAFLALDRDWRYTYLNGKALAMTGYPAEELLGKRIWDVYPRLIDTPLHTAAVRAMEERVDAQVEHHLARGVWFDVRAYPSEQGISLYFQDITARKLAERERESLLQREQDALAQAQAARDRLEATLESIADAFFSIDREWRYTYLNERAALLLGRDRAELLGKVIWDEFPQGARSEIADEYRRALADRQPRRLEYESPTLGVWVEVHIYPSPDGLAVYYQDIGERKRAEQALRESEHRLHLATSAARIGHFEIDWVARTRHWSPELRALLAVPDDLDISADAGLIDRILPSEYRARYRAALAASLDPAGSGEYEDEHEVVRLDGTHGWMVMRGKTFFEDGPDGVRPARTVGLMMDITERKRAETERAWLSNAVEQATDSVVIRDLDGVVLTWNPGAERLYGYSAAEIVGHAVEALVPPERAGEIGAMNVRVARGERIAQIETVRIRKGGSPVEIAMSVSPVYDAAGKVVGLCAIGRDISERRGLERMRQELVSMLGHELRNPLASLKGHAQLMRRRGAYNERSLEVIIGQAGQIERRITDLTDLSRLEAGRLPLERAPMDLVELVHACAEQAQGLSAAHTIRVEAPDTPIVGVWDRDRLGQVLDNLLSNAVKYAPDGGDVVVRVEQADREALVSVVDGGLGIDAAELPKLFDRFYRADGSAERACGLGLGLHIARGLVEAHVGRIWAESDGPGQESTFRLALPLATSDAWGPAPQAPL